ncbi:putative alpha/beta hydrolase [Brevibacterium epidermidis]|jgi:predicted alpha/beta hydrolase|uniref:Alpha/beta hydrolase n=1 Tax=Brevibacterium epidermidis TaxID=1698 RepID=A0ABV4EHA4_BREEP
MPDTRTVTTTVPSRDGSRIGVVEFGRPPQDDSRASLLFLPALGVALGYYSDMLTQWAQQDRHIVAVEHRGMPLSPNTDIRGARFGYSTIIREDVPAVADRWFHGSRPFVAVGHSLGGQLALLATASRAIEPQKVAAIAAGTSSPAAMSTALGRAKRRGQVAFIRATSAAMGYWPGERLGFGGRQPRSLMRDWCTEGSRGRYHLHGDSTDYESALATIDQPVFLLSLDGDPIITLPAATHLARRLPSHAKHHRLSSKTADGFDHIRWARREPGTVINAVETWLDEPKGRHSAITDRS